jgi:hypothetical protein
MAKTFLISQANPMPFRQIKEFAYKYNTIPFDLQPTARTVNGCYYQKWEFGDDTKIQYLSDYPDVTITVYKLGTRISVATILPVEKVSNIQNQTFKVYEAEFDFSDYGNGFFYAEISFVDDDSVLNIYQSQAWQTANKWPETVLFEYKNSFNNYSVVFETGITFNTRLEAQIREFTPQFEDELYIDEMHNATQLNSIPFKQFKLTTQYLPDWALNLLNWVLNVDEKQIDSVYYEKTTGAKLEIQRVDGYAYGIASIDIIPVENFFLQRLKSGDMADGLYTIITKRLQWIDNAVNRTINGSFRVNTNLRRVDLINKGLDAFTINIGTTDGGAEIATADVTADDETYTLIIHHFFDSDTPVYITGIAGAQLNLFVIFDQDDEPNINISTDGAQLFPKNFRGSFLEIADGELEASFDLASGLGKPNTGYSNCAICDGRNGTPNLMDSYSIFVGISNIALLGSAVGSNSKLIAKTNLPNSGVGLFASYVNASGGDQGPNETDHVARSRQVGNSYETAKAPGNITQISGISFPLGDATPLDIRPKSIYELPFLAIN